MHMSFNLPLIQQLHFQELIPQVYTHMLAYTQAYSSQHDVHYSKDLNGDALNGPRFYSLKKIYGKKNMEQQVQCIAIYIKGEYLY